MNKFFSILTLIIGATFISFSNNAYAAGEGEQIFTANCTACHAGGQNLIIPDKNLKKEALADNSMNSVSAIVTQVTNGKGAMPAFGGRLTDENIQDVANYVLSQSEAGW